MIRFLIRKFKKASFPGKLLILPLLIALYWVWFVAFIQIDTFLLNLLIDICDQNWLIIATSTILLPITLFGPFYYYQIISDEEKKSAKKIEYGQLPHFDKIFGKNHVAKVLKDEIFHYYVDKSGKKCKHIKVSYSDNWICILGGYMPIDLILGYNKYSNKIYTIDGGEIQLPEKARKPAIRDSIEAFFKERGLYYNTAPKKAGSKLEQAISGSKSELSKADWGRVRYLWEKAMASSGSGYLNGSNGRDHKYTPFSKTDGVNTTIFEQVLSDGEIRKTVSAIKKLQVPLSRFLDFNKYKNEFCVCNGIELLEELKYPRNEEGIDFLFDCLRDIDEAYFFPAVELLKTYPHDKCKLKIEEYAKVAYESRDALRLAALLFLAKELSYEIEYVKKAKAESETIPGFEVDSEDIYGSGKVVAFVPGGMT